MLAACKWSKTVYRMSCMRRSNVWTPTDGEAELQHMHGSFLLQEVHETKEEILLLPDLFQLQLQHL